METLGRVRSIVISKLTVFFGPSRPEKYRKILSCFTIQARLTVKLTVREVTVREAQWPIGYGVVLRIKRSSVRIRPRPLRWVPGQGSLLPLSQGETFTLASISYLAILVKYILAKNTGQKFFRSGPSCPTDRARCFFFGFVLFVLFIFYFLLIFFSLVPDCTTTQRKFSPAVKYPLFAAHSTSFGWQRLCFSCSSPCTHPLRKSGAGFDGSSSSTISSQRCRHTRSPSSDPRRSFHDLLRQYGRFSQVLEWFLSITRHWVAQSKGYRLTACSWFPFHAEKEMKK